MYLLYNKYSAVWRRESYLSHDANSERLNIFINIYQGYFQKQTRDQKYLVTTCTAMKVLHIRKGKITVLFTCTCPDTPPTQRQWTSMVHRWQGNYKTESLAFKCGEDEGHITNDTVTEGSRVGGGGLFLITDQYARRPPPPPSIFVRLAWCFWPHFWPSRIFLPKFCTFLPLFSN